MNFYHLGLIKLRIDIISQVFEPFILDVRGSRYFQFEFELDLISILFIISLVLL